MKKNIIIVAGGKGKRFGENTPKQFIPINGRPILMHTIDKFYRYDPSITIIIALINTHIDYWKMLCVEYNFNIPHIITSGGEERYFSVKNALDYVPADSIVGVHDAVRPFVSHSVIEKAFTLVIDKQSVAPAIKPDDSVRYISKNTSHPEILIRKNVFLIQTPQCFHSNVLKKAYEGNYNPELTDDISIVEEELKVHPTLIEGEKENIKITTPVDIFVSEFLCNKRDPNK